MKILFLSHAFFPAIGGIESISEMLAKEFCELGHDIHLMTWTADNGEAVFNYPVIRKPSLQTILREIGWCDVIFENNPCIRLSWPNIFYRKPQVTGLQTWLSGKDTSNTLYDWVKKLLIRRSSRLIACSNAVKNNIDQSAIVIGNPYNDNKYYTIAGISKNKDFVFLGRLVSDKGADIALTAFKEFVQGDDRSASTLTIIGDGPERNALEEYVDRYQLRSRVFFTGSLRADKIAPLLNEHRFMLVPSLWKEPFGIVALEAMACGCVPIVSDGGGLPDAVGNAGIVVERGSYQSLLAAMEKVYHSTELQRELTDNAKEHLKQHQAKRVAQAYLQVLQKAVSGN